MGTFRQPVIAKFKIVLLCIVAMLSRGACEIDKAISACLCRCLLAGLLLGVTCIASASSQRLAEELQVESDRLAAVVSIVQKKARKSLVNTAQDRAFRRYFSTKRATNRRILRFHFDLILETLRDVRQMEEVALVGNDGKFIAQVKEEVIRQRDFEDATSVTFFEDALEGPERQAYTSRIHRLAGSENWVVSYATPILHEGKSVALLYYDQGLDIFQRSLDLLRRNDGIRRLAVSSDGRILWDSEREPSRANNEDIRDVNDDLPVFQLAGQTLGEIIVRVEQDALIHEASSNNTFSVAYTRVKDWYFLSVLPAARVDIADGRPDRKDDTPFPAAALPASGASKPIAH